MSREAVRWRIRGKVQGVGFRAFTARRARELGLAGRVRNLPDGSVEAEAAGPREELDRLAEAVRRGPRGARVDDLSESALAEDPGWDDFRVDYP